MRRAPRLDPAIPRALAALALAGGLAAADKAPPAPKAYLLLSAPSQTRETLRGTVRGSTAARYVIEAAPGEALDVKLTAANPAVYYTLRTPGGSVLLYDSSDPDAATRFSRRLAPGGRYRLEVRLADAAARRNTAANYTLSIAREGRIIPTR